MGHSYDLSMWHPDCTGKSVFPTPTGMCIYCPECGVVADVEAVSGKISAADACKVAVKDRKIIGDVSPNTLKGEHVL